MKLKHLLLLSLGLSFGASFTEGATYTGSYWTNGVSETGGWYDANKKNPNDGDADDNMCYAASAANLIAWWQNGKVGSTLASDAPRELKDIWQELVNNNQKPEEGGEALSVINWWISGVYCPGSMEDTAAWERYYIARNAWAASDMLEALPEVDGYYYDQYTLSQQNLADAFIDFSMSNDAVTEIDFAELLRNGCGITLYIETEAGNEAEAMGHAITLWGVEYSEDGKLSTIWITDSDDGAEELVKLSVTVDEANDKIWLGDEYFASDSFYISQVYAFDIRETFKWSERSALTYVTLKVNPKTHNGRAGVALLTDVFMNEETDEGEEEVEEEEVPSPDEDEPEYMALEEEELNEEEEEEEVVGALESISDAMDAGEMNDRDAAAVAGASTAVLGQAFAGDVERQLGAIRNRAAMDNLRPDVVTPDGKGGSLEQPSKFFAWVNAEGNHTKQNNDGTTAGYTLSSWGGTLGAGMQVHNQLTLGLALTAMYGNLQSDGPDYLKGDMDTTYVSAYTHYVSGKWSHSFIGTVGTMDANYTRYAMGYSNEGDTDGTAFGLMYELAREYNLNDWSKLSPLFNISYRHTTADSYSECGTNAALNVGEQNIDTVTVALGARYAAIVGQQMLNRACSFEARALAKYDFGDTRSNASVGFVNYATRANIESAKRGAMGLELGAGISMPMGCGSIFTDGAVELRSDYTNFNAAVGYKIQF